MKQRRDWSPCSNCLEVRNDWKQRSVQSEREWENINFFVLFLEQWTHVDSQTDTVSIYKYVFALWVRESPKILGRIHGTKGHMQRDWLDTQSKLCVNFVDNAVTPLTYPQVGNLEMLCYMSKLLVIFESIDESSGRRWHSVRSMCCAYQSFLKVTINCTRTISSVKLPLIIVVFFSNNVKFLLKKL